MIFSRRWGNFTRKNFIRWTGHFDSKRAGIMRSKYFVNVPPPPRLRYSCLFLPFFIKMVMECSFSWGHLFIQKQWEDEVSYFEFFLVKGLKREQTVSAAYMEARMINIIQAHLVYNHFTVDFFVKEPVQDFIKSLSTFLNRTLKLFQFSF